jgi:hypothetical protein
MLKLQTPQLPLLFVIWSSKLCFAHQTWIVRCFRWRTRLWFVVTAKTKRELLHRGVCWVCATNVSEGLSVRNRTSKVQDHPLICQSQKRCKHDPVFIFVWLFCFVWKHLHLWAFNLWYPWIREYLVQTGLPFMPSFLQSYLYTSP